MYNEIHEVITDPYLIFLFSLEAEPLDEPSRDCPFSLDDSKEYSHQYPGITAQELDCRISG